VVLGLSVGLFLGVHLLIASSRTFGHGVRIDEPTTYLGAIAYDVGLSALTAEWLFRGALFSRWWRRWPFGTAAFLSVGCAVLRCATSWRRCAPRRGGGASARPPPRGCWGGGPAPPAGGAGASPGDPGRPPLSSSPIVRSRPGAFLAPAALLFAIAALAWLGAD